MQKVLFFPVGTIWRVQR